MVQLSEIEEGRQKRPLMPEVCDVDDVFTSNFVHRNRRRTTPVHLVSAYRGVEDVGGKVDVGDAFKHAPSVPAQFRNPHQKTSSSQNYTYMFNMSIYPS